MMDLSGWAEPAKPGDFIKDLKRAKKILLERAQIPQKIQCVACLKGYTLHDYYNHSCLKP